MRYTPTWRRDRDRRRARLDDAADAEPPGGAREEFSHWPDRPDGFNREGLVGLDASAVFDRDSDAIYQPDPADADIDEAPRTEVAERGVLDDVTRLDGDNFDLAETPPFGLEDL